MVSPNPMKVLSALFSASLLLAVPLHAQDGTPVREPQSRPFGENSGTDPAKTGLTAPVTGPSSREEPAPSDTGKPIQLAPTPVAPLAPTPVPSTPLIPDTQTTFVKPPSMITKKERPSRTEEAETDLLQQIHFREA